MTKRRLAMERLLAVDPVAPQKASEPRVRAVAVRSMGLSLERLHETSAQETERVVELDPALCEPSFVRDRLEAEGEDGDTAGIAALAQSIAEGGQAVPILVRPIAGKGRYQIAYGHRRWLACRRLGWPVKAIVRSLGDEDLVIAQGRENNERRDLSFIERAHFAAALVGLDLSRAVVCKALGIDKSELARLLAVANGLPEGLAERIGRAPKVGRPRWLDLVRLCATAEKARTALAAAAACQMLATDDRFKAVYDAVREETRPAPSSRNEAPPARIEIRDGATVITIEETGEKSFGAFVGERLETLYGDYLAQQAGSARSRVRRP